MCAASNFKCATKAAVSMAMPHAAADTDATNAPAGAADASCAANAADANAAGPANANACSKCSRYSCKRNSGSVSNGNFRCRYSGCMPSRRKACHTNHKRRSSVSLSLSAFLSRCNSNTRSCRQRGSCSLRVRRCHSNCRGICSLRSQSNSRCSGRLSCRSRCSSHGSRRSTRSSHRPRSSHGVRSSQARRRAS